MNRPYVKIFIFLILILILGAVSYAVRDFLILGFDGANFGLISIEYVKTQAQLQPFSTAYNISYCDFRYYSCCVFELYSRNNKQN